MPTPLAVGRLTEKLQRFQKDPLGTLSRRARYTFEPLFYWSRKAYEQVRFRWPVYQLCGWALNKTPEKLYGVESANMVLSRLQQRIVYQLEQTGLAIVHLDDLFPTKRFDSLQQRAENSLKNTSPDARMRAIESGEKTVDDFKFYLIMPWGGVPAFDPKDEFLNLSLSDEILGIVCKYLNTFTRLVHINLWCNVPTAGRDTYSQRWHRDPDDKKLVKLFLYLRDVDESTGPFCYIPGSHNGGPFRNIFPQTMYTSHYPRDGEIEKSFSQKDITMCTGRAGTLILCDTSGFHKGGHPEHGLRLLFTCTYTTNSGVAINGKRFSVNDLRRETLTPAANYAISHLYD